MIGTNVAPTFLSGVIVLACAIACGNDRNAILTGGSESSAGGDASGGSNGIGAGGRSGASSGGTTSDGGTTGGVTAAGGASGEGGIIGRGGAPGAGGTGSGGASTGGVPGSGNASGTGGAQGTGGGSAATPTLPTATNCPTFTNGGTVQIARKNGTQMPVVIYVDPAAKSKPDPGGPVVLYYHSTGGDPSQVHIGFGDANINQVTAMGGVVAAFTSTACPSCQSTDIQVWFDEDDDVADTVVACAAQQAKIDARRIHAVGFSSGALHTCHMALTRSTYLASFVSYSGGVLFPATDADPTNHVSSILAYGQPGSTQPIDFWTQSKEWYSTYQPLGWYTMMCQHTGGPKIDPDIATVSLKFFLDHPYKVNPEPYVPTIASGFPSYCKNAP